MLLMYFLVLPILFCFHLNHPAHNEESVDYYTEELVLSNETEDCQWCDLYQNNDAFFLETGYSQVGSEISDSPTILFKQHWTSIDMLQSLRGPPVI